jgi:hypothetical protein
MRCVANSDFEKGKLAHHETTREQNDYRYQQGLLATYYLLLTYYRYCKLVDSARARVETGKSRRNETPTF